jgi:hypothetical protein
VSAREPIRSYQRIFRPDRRLHHIEGRALPVPGGVPLRWLGYAGSTLLAVLALGTGSLLVYLALAACGAATGAALGGRPGAVIAGGSVLVASWLAGQLLGALDWPIRLVVIPAGVAILATQTTPDGRPAHRFAAAWLALRISPRRRSLGRALPNEDVPRVEDASVWVAPDEHSPVLRKARLRGEGIVAFRSPVLARRSRIRQGRVTVTEGEAPGRGGAVEIRRLAIVAGEKVEVRP